MGGTFAFQYRLELKFRRETIIGLSVIFQYENDKYWSIDLKSMSNEFF